jgi:oligoribonuclease NrnB/cAMP/cGMP phosphodiesterase (DHH superfamily)
MMNLTDVLLEKVSYLKHQLAEMTKDRDLWKDVHDDKCPNTAIVETLTKELAEARKAAEWIPVRERMPDNSKAVLVWCPERKNKYTACWKVPYWLHFGGACSSEVTEDVTHWKPLPNPPEKLSK